MISQEQFDKAKAASSGKDPLIKKVKLSDIRIDDNSLKTGNILIGDSKIPVSNKFFNRLGQVVNLQTSLLNRMDKNADHSVQTKLLQAVKSYSETRDGDKEFLLIGDGTAREVTNIVKADKYHRLSNETLFDTAGLILNEVPDMHVESIDNSGGGVSINLIHGSQVGFDKIGKDEVFRFGVSLVNSATNSRVDDFFLRLSCDNGAVARNLNTAFEFGQGQDAFRKLLDSMTGWSKAGFVPRTFETRLEGAIRTKASYGELERVMNSVIGQIHDEDVNVESHYIRAAQQQFFPEFDITSKRIFKNGHNPQFLTEAQKKFIKTDSSIWDLVNELTWIGSHATTFNFQAPKKFKVEGGNLFAKSWDLEHASLAAI